MRIFTKRFSVFLSMLFILNSVSAQTFCLKLEEVNASVSGVEVELFMQASASINLGSSNFQFTFDETLLTNPLLGTENLGAFYNVTVTRPLSNKVSFNVELFIPNNGAPIAVSPAWTSLGTITFDALAATPSTLNWSYSGGTTESVAFLDDEATQIFATAAACLAPLTIFTNLPVELLSFDAEWTDPGERESHLFWTTLSETGTDYFAVLRSFDGQNWTEIGRMTASPGSVEETRYDFADLNPGNSLNGSYLYYKLEMLDQDGSKSVSEIEVLKRTRAISLGLFPNPFNESVVLYFDEHLNKEYTKVNISDVAGQLVYSADLDQTDHNNSWIKFRLDHLEAGMYFLTILSGKDSHSFKLIKH